MKVFNSSYPSRSQSVIKGSQEKNSRQELETETMLKYSLTGFWLTCSKAYT